VPAHPIPSRQEAADGLAAFKNGRVEATVALAKLTLAIASGRLQTGATQGEPLDAEPRAGRSSGASSDRTGWEDQAMTLRRLLARFLRRSEPPAYDVRRDRVRYEICDAGYFEVFWKVLDIGRGPAVSLFIRDTEVMKFDCFGEGRGHVHIDFGRTGHLKALAHHRLYLGEKAVEEQIERTIFELRMNLPYYLERHGDARIRAFQPTTERLHEVTAKVREAMLTYAETVAGLPAGS
jgi:hypothetical protein